MDNPAQDATTTSPSFLTTTSTSFSAISRLGHDANASYPDSKPYDMSVNVNTNMDASHADHASNTSPKSSSFPANSNSTATTTRLPFANHHMGQSPSRLASSARPPTTASASLGVHLAQSGLIATQKIKRAFGGKRTKSVDLNKAVAEDSDNELVRSASKQSNPAKQLTMHLASSMQALTGKKHRSTSSASLQPPSSPLPPPVPPKHAGANTNTSSEHIHVNKPSEKDAAHSGRISPLQPVSDKDSQSPNSTILGAKPSADPGTARGAVAVLGSDKNATTTTDSNNNATDVPSSEPIPRRRERRETARESEDWRKSDSTMRTVRLVGNRTPRPLSLAESTNSGHTVQGSGTGTPPASRRLSALMIDAEFATPEVESEDESVQILTLQRTDTTDENPGPYVNRRSPPLSSTSTQSTTTTTTAPSATTSKAQKRRSLSSPLPGLSPKGKSKFVDESNSNNYWSSDSEAVSSLSTGTANSSTTSITSSPSHSDSMSGKDAYAISNAPHGDLTTTSSRAETSSNHSHGDGSQGATPWLATTRASISSVSLSTSTSSSKELPAMPSSQPGPDLFQTASPIHVHIRPKRIASQPKGFRQTAVSITSGLGRRIGRAFGGSTSSISIASDHSHGSTSGSWKKHEANSGRWSPRPSIGTTSSQSDTEGGSHAQHVGPYLGQMVRPPKWHGASGLVFGRPLKDCVLETAVAGNNNSGTRGGGNLDKRHRNSQSESHLDHLSHSNAQYRTSTTSSAMSVLVSGSGSIGRVSGSGVMATTTFSANTTTTNASLADIIDLRALEERRLPALALRCAQHLVKWGTQEEGLFRVNGRPTHITKIRNEFDSGADYDMSECGPGDIDPHAVASVFKAYLRELPEPLLTRNLTQFFEAAMSAENSLIQASVSESSVADRSLRGLRKPPSLSTLALPAFHARKHSMSLLSTLAELIAQLPPENRDLLKTVTELIRATASRSKETKMPLSNLLLVFCPSLTMSPPLLRVLCEGQGIWDGPMPKEDEVLDIKPGGADGGGKKDAKEGEGESEASEKEDCLQVMVKPRSSIKKAPPADIIVPELSKTVESVPETTSSTNESTPTPPQTQHNTDSSPEESPDTQTLDLSTPPLTSSSTSTGSPNSTTEDDRNRTEPTTPSKLRTKTMRKQSDLPSPFRVAVRKSLIGSPIPVPFPLSGSAPSTPVVGLKPSLLLTGSSSSPDLGPSTPTSPGGSGRRKTRPSLHDLLPKRSLSSLLARPLSTYSAESPASAVSSGARSGAGGDADVETGEEQYITAPQSRVVSICPVLDIPVVHSPIKMGMDIEIGFEDPFRDRTGVVEEGKMSNETARLRVNTCDGVVNRVSSTSSVAQTVYYTPMSQPLSLAPSVGATSSRDSYSFLDLRIKDSPSTDGDSDDDWAKSVLMAADANASNVDARS